MNFSDIVGQDALVRNLAAQINSGQAAHAYLFAGPPGTGKRSLADICARALNCVGDESPAASARDDAPPWATAAPAPRIVKPCDKCPRCVRWLSGNFPDLMRITPARSIGVDEIRSLIERVQVRPYEGGRNVIIIQDAHLMTPQAQNALLKTLENPPGDAAFFLLSAQPRLLLPTVISRCRLVNFRRLDSDVVARYLVERQNMPRDRARLLALISQGSIGEALLFMNDAEYWRVRELALTGIQALRVPADVARFSAKLKDGREHADWLFSALELYARDLMLLQNGADAGMGCANQDMLDALTRQSEYMRGDALLSAVMDARRRLRSNVGWQTITDMMALSALEGIQQSLKN